jgi:hypothetical protein
MNEIHQYNLQREPGSATVNGLTKAAAVVGAVLAAADQGSAPIANPHRPRRAFKGLWTQKQAGACFERKRLMRVQAQERS